jgi:hypothetical protein
MQTATNSLWKKRKNTENFEKKLSKERSYDEIIIIVRHREREKSIFNWDLPNSFPTGRIELEWILKFSGGDSDCLRCKIKFSFPSPHTQRVTQLFSDDSHPYVYMQCYGRERKKLSPLDIVLGNFPTFKSIRCFQRCLLLIDRRTLVSSRLGKLPDVSTFLPTARDQSLIGGNAGCGHGYMRLNKTAQLGFLLIATATLQAFQHFRLSSIRVSRKYAT